MQIQQINLSCLRRGLFFPFPPILNFLHSASYESVELRSKLKYFGVPLKYENYVNGFGIRPSQSLYHQFSSFFLGATAPFEPWSALF
jgi:hypothetical protein